MLRDGELAWDASQEVMTRYLEASRRREIQQPLYYLYRASTNHCLDVLQQAKRSLLLPPELLELRNESTSAFFTEGSLVVEQLVKRFGKEDIALLVHRYVDQMTYDEIAQIYGKSDRGINKKIARIEDKARKYLSR